MSLGHVPLIILGLLLALLLIGFCLMAVTIIRSLSESGKRSIHGTRSRPEYELFFRTEHPEKGKLFMKLPLRYFEDSNPLNHMTIERRGLTWELFEVRDRNLFNHVVWEAEYGK